jgi:hypothetical protein
MPPGFAEHCASRGVAPDVMATRLCELYVEVDREARDIFKDWDAWPPEDEVQFLRGAVKARADLEVPRR